MRSTLRVLHVEDSERDVALLTRHLERAGYDLHSERVETPAGMRSALSAQEWDVILCDYSMPHFNALQALELLKETGLDIPLIIISGTVGEAVAVGAMRAGAQDYLMKDNLVRLAPTIERELQEAENRRARRRAEAALKESEDRYRDLVEHSHDLICTHDLDGRVLSVNQMAARRLGFEKEALIGRNIREILLAESLEGFDEYIAVIQKKGIAKGLMVVRTRAGENLTWEYTNTLRTEGVTAPIVRGMAHDVTECRQLEEQLRQSQKMEAVGQLAGGVAHDFNNLLTAINGYSDLVLRRLPAEDPLRDNVEEIKKAGERAAVLTRQLLAFSRKQVLRPVALDLNAAVSDMEKMLRRLIGEDVELRTALNPELGSVKADPGQIEQVLLNLVVNARDAMPRGGKLIIETENVYLGEDYARQHVSATPGPYVMLAVSDTGTGIDAETQARIFEPFFTTKELGKGTGLGLSTVYGIVKQSGGQIWVYSEVGRGTTFKVYLPRVDEGAQEYRRGAEPKANLRGAETILLAEDEELVRKLAREVLELYGYRVLEAADGVATLLICEQHKEPIHLLVTDVIMPELSVHTLASRLNRLRPEMRVLYMSGYADNAIVNLGVLDAGANFIQKPFSPDDLARKVREILDEPR